MFLPFRRTCMSPWLPKVHSTCKSRQKSQSAPLLIPSCCPPMPGTHEINPVLLQPWQRGSALRAMLMCSSPQQTDDNAALMVAQKMTAGCPYHCWHGARTGHRCCSADHGSMESCAGGLQALSPLLTLLSGCFW